MACDGFFVRLGPAITLLELAIYNNKICWIQEIGKGKICWFWEIECPVGTPYQTTQLYTDRPGNRKRIVDNVRDPFSGTGRDSLRPPQC